ncbi:MAG: hypothetical protein Q4G16_06550 [Cruoricaptor ignavus]|nr:hypothetical protein [Cruoricaptor ignavus]
MIRKYREQFNQEFSQEKYEQVINDIEKNAGISCGFRISESPIFLSSDFKEKLVDACESIIHQIKKIPNAELQNAIPENCRVPNDTEKPHFLVIDFGICKNENGDAEPQLIELQAFPALYTYNEAYKESIIKAFPFCEPLKNPLSKSEYLQIMKDIIVANENPENVVLLEIFPEKQKTNIDFYLTEKYLGIKTLCLTKVKKDGKKLYYEKDGTKIPIHRIYNRVIFDELQQIPDLETEFDFREEVDVNWVTHPNWFFKVSKYILPKLSHQFIPKSYFLKDFPPHENLDNFVLKPLFSFAGSGVNLSPTSAEIAQITDKENYILQKKVQYAPLFEDINGEKSKAEIRMLYLWKENEDLPQLMDNLVRMTKVEMANVSFNKKDAIWIGSSIAFFEKE